MARHRATGDYMRPAFGLLLEKLAYGPEDIPKVMAAVRKRTTTAPMPTMTKLTGGAGLALPPTGRASRRIYSVADRAAAAAPEGTPRGAPVEIPESLKQTLVQELSQVDRPSIRLAAGKSKMYPETRDIAAGYGPSKMNIWNRRALSSIIRGHELDELSFLPRASHVTLGMGHVNPGVIFREHNRVTTLPSTLQQAAGTMRNLRLGFEDAQLLGRFGLTYGRSPRLSRHAIKRLTESLERKGVRVTMGDKPRDRRAPVEKLIADNNANTSGRAAREELELEYLTRPDVPGASEPSKLTNTQGTVSEADLPPEVLAKARLARGGRR